MKTVFIAGGAGFIGSHFARRVLARSGWRVVLYDKLTYAGNLLNLQDVITDPRLIFVHGDICDRELLESVMNVWRPVSVVNFAAETHVDRSIDSPRRFLESNVVGTFELLEAVRHLWQQLKPAERCQFRFVHVSTDEVYGSLDESG